MTLQRKCHFVTLCCIQETRFLVAHHVNEVLIPHRFQSHKSIVSETQNTQKTTHHGYQETTPTRETILLHLLCPHARRHVGMQLHNSLFFHSSRRSSSVGNSNNNAIMGIIMENNIMVSYHQDRRTSYFHNSLWLVGSVVRLGP